MKYMQLLAALKSIDTIFDGFIYKLAMMIFATFKLKFNPQT